MAARCGLAQRKPGDEVQHQHEHRAPDDGGLPQLEGVAQRDHARRDVGDGLRARVQLRGGKRDVERAQRDDEGRQLDLGDQQAVDQTKQHGHRHAAGNGHGAERP